MTNPIGFDTPEILQVYRTFITMTSNLRNKKSLLLRRKQRDGSVVVEAALVLPIIIGIMFGTLEICSGYYVQESITIASYEGARYAAREYGRVRGDDEAPFSEAEVTDYVTEILTDRGVVSSPTIDIDLSGRTFETIQPLEPIRVTVSCGTEGNSTFVFDYMAARTLSATVVFAAE